MIERARDVDPERVRELLEFIDSVEDQAEKRRLIRALIIAIWGFDELPVVN
jgi:hypothetical protein